MPKGINLTITTKRDSDGRNVVEWSLENSSGHDYYLFDGIAADPSSPAAGPGDVYFRWREGDTLILYQGIPEVPDMMSVLLPYVPKASRLDDSSIRVKRTTLPDTVPTNLYYGHFDDPTGEGEPRMAAHAAFVQIRVGAVRDGGLAVVDAGRSAKLQFYDFRDMDKTIAAAEVWRSARIPLHHPVLVVD